MLYSFNMYTTMRYLDIVKCNKFEKICYLV